MLTPLQKQIPHMFSFHLTVYLYKNEECYIPCAQILETFFLNTRAREQTSLCVPLAFPFTPSTTHKQTSLPKITFGMVNSTVAQLLCKVR